MKNKTFTFSFLIICSFFISLEINAQCHPDDYTALRALYLSAGGDGWNNKTGWDVSNASPPAGCDVCSWSWVICNDAGRVISLSIRVNGTLPPELGKLTSLVKFQMAGNINGVIPSELGNLVNLEILNIQNTQLSGSIPPELGNLTNLKDLLLSGNQLSGSIPKEFGKLLNLSRLELDDNQLSGSIPSELGNLTNLVILLLDKNQLSGTIPSELGNLSQLLFLHLNDNPLSGCIPNSFRSFCGKVRSLFLFNTDLEEQDFNVFCSTNSGACPECEGDEHPDLNALIKFYDDMGGDNWEEADNWASDGDTSCDPCQDNWFGVVCREGRVVELNLPDNNVDGALELADLRISELNHLEKINLSGNEGVKWSLGVLLDIPTLKEIDLSNCGLLSIGSNINELPNLEVLKLSGNNIWGYDGLELDQLSKLIHLDLSYNGMTGIVGAGFNTANFPNLETLLLNNNNLGWCLFPLLKTLCGRNVDLSNNLALSEDDFSKVCNEDSGICPPTNCAHPDWEPLMMLYASTGGPNNWENKWDVFSSCDPCGDNWYGINCENGRVTSLQLCNNGLSGAIPIELYNLTKLKDLSLCENQLVGTLNSDISQLSQLERLDLGNNNLQGELPSSLWNLANLNFLTVGNNGFTGAIPSAISNLTNLWLLNLRTNNFSSIDLSALANLTHLEILEFQENGLSGDLPDIFTGMNDLHNLRIHDNNFTGSLPSSLGNKNNLEFVLFQNNNFSGCYPASYNNLCNISEINFANNHNLEEQDFNSFCSCSIGSCDNPQHPDYVPLIALYNATNGPNWTNNTNWATNCDVCTWEGITCNDNGRVSIITLPNNNLWGELPSEIGQLMELIEIFLDSNNLFGDIPEALYNIPTLENIILSNNYIEGALSDNICQLNNLNEIRVHNNQLGGEIPSCLENFTNLLVINLSNNNFSGCYPDNWLTYCNNDQINFDGNICLRDWTEYCNSNGDCSGNTFGEHPDFAPLMAFYNETNGTNWTNNDNWGTCDPCTWYGVSCRGNRVTDLVLDNNNLSGTIPAEIAQLTQMFYIVLSNNNLSGTFPDIFNSWHQLHDIRITNNNFEGPLPYSLGFRTTLRVAEFYNNNFSGCFPFSYKNLCTNKATIFQSGFGFGGNPQLPNGGDFDTFCSTDAGICEEDIGCEWLELEIQLGTQEVNLNYEFATIEEGATYFTNTGGYSFGTNSPNATLNYVLQLQPGTFQFNIANWANNGLDFFQLRNLSTGEVLVDNQDFSIFFSSDLFDVCPIEECPDEFIIAVDISNTSTIFQAHNIIASSTIDATSSITFKADNTITLLPGFTTQTGADFLATIEDCPISMQSVTEPELAQLQTTTTLIPTSMLVYPNPFSNQTTIEYTLTEETEVILQVVDMLGEQVAILVDDSIQNKGAHQVTFNRQQLQGGTYFIILQKGNEYESQKLILLE